jgi:hypothetical protein
MYVIMVQGFASKVLREAGTDRRSIALTEIAGLSSRKAIIETTEITMNTATFKYISLVKLLPL